MLVLGFVAAAWGMARTGAGLRPGRWVVNGGQVVALGVLVWVQQPLLAGLAGLLFFGGVALQLGLRFRAAADERWQAATLRWMWFWLLAAMVVAALALP
jgi:hypothetical protein